MPRRNHRILFFTLLASTCSLYYVGCIHRVHETIAQDGWVLQWSYRLFACPHCTGRVRTLEFEGKSIACPADASYDEVPKVKLTLQTPIATLTCYRAESTWRVLTKSDSRPAEFCGDVTSDELASGYYDVSDDTSACRKRGTPRNWCVGMSDKYYRWLDPRLIDKLPW